MSRSKDTQEAINGIALMLKGSLTYLEGARYFEENYRDLLSDENIPFEDIKLCYERMSSLMEELKQNTTIDMELFSLVY
jgi:hypothetical protein